MASVGCSSNWINWFQSMFGSTSDSDMTELKDSDAACVSNEDANTDADDVGAGDGAGAGADGADTATDFFTFLVTLAPEEPDDLLWLGSQRTFFLLQASHALITRIRWAWSRCYLVLHPREAELVTSIPSLVSIFIPGR